MIVTGKRLVLTLAIGFVALGVGMWIFEIARPVAPVVCVIAGAVGLIVGALMPASSASGSVVESDDMTELEPDRRQELMRGTSKFLGEMKYRYSIRLDTTNSNERRCFSAEVNTVRLGFLPAIITDNTNERQGYGYVAFVHDGTRWRGPGLPCPCDQVDAVRHAARCVSPLATDEETQFDTEEATRS